MVLEQWRNQPSREDDELHTASIMHTCYCAGTLPCIRMYRCPRHIDLRHDRTSQASWLPRIPILYHVGYLDDCILLHSLGVYSNMAEDWKSSNRQFIAIPPLEILLGYVPNCDTMGVGDLYDLLVSPLSRR